MSEVYQTEEEQIEAIKKWWRENGKSTLIGIALAISAVFGWQGWQKQQQQTAYAASAAYQNLLEVVAKSQAGLSEEQLATASHLADSLKNDYSSSVYAQYAALYKAQLAVNKNDLVGAEAELRWVLTQKPTQELMAQTHLRLARVYVAKQEFDLALAELNAEALAYQAQYAELRGDIYLAKGDENAARDAFEQAKQLANANKNSGVSTLLELKLQQLKPAEEV